MTSREDSWSVQLLAEGDFVRQLARELVGTGDADDLAQDVWLAAARDGATAVRAPQSWLARIARRLASNGRRADRRRRAREHEFALQRPERTADPAAIVACEQVRQRVVAAVLALDEPFRATVLARYYEGLDTPAIAARDGVPAPTVRSRLKRGLDRLRERLDTEHRGERVAWAAPLGVLARAPMSPASRAGILMTTTKKLAAASVVLSLVALGTVGVWCVRTGAIASAPGSGESARATAAGAERAPPPAPPSERTAAAAAAVAASVSGLPFPLRDVPLDEVLVRVLDAAGAPAAGAEVCFVPFVVDLEHPAARADRALHEAVATESFRSRFGRRVRTDAAGEASIHVPRTGSVVTARRDGWFAAEQARPTWLLPEQRFVLRLARTDALVVRVVATDTRLPVPAVVVEYRARRPWALVDRAEDVKGKALTDAEGLARFDLVGEVGEIHVRAGAAAAPQLVPSGQRFAELELAPSGSLLVEVRTPSGQRWPTAVDVSARSGAPGSPREISIPSASWMQLAEGVCRIPDVPLGRDWELGASLVSVPLPTVHRPVRGPSTAGEEVHVVLTTAREPCLAFATVRLASGAPLEGRVAVFQDGTRGSACRGTMFVAADGRIGWPVVAATRAVSASSATGFVEAPIPARQARLRVAWRLDATTPGAHELGELVLAEPPVIAGGRVVVSEEPWAGAAVRVCCEVRGRDGTWQRHGVAEVHPHEDPSFTFRGDTDAREARVSVVPDPHVLGAEPVVLAVGAGDAQLVVTRGVALHARVIAPSAYAPSLRCRVVRADGAPLPVMANSRTHTQTGSWRDVGEPIDFDGVGARHAWPALPPGTYRVEVLAPGIATPLTVLHGVHVAIGGAPDPRLAAIDVRPFARELTIVAHGAPAELLARGAALARPAEAPAPAMHGLMLDERGEARLLVGAGPVDLAVAVPGRRLWRAHAVAGTHVVATLEPPLEVPFRLAPPVAAALAGQRVHVELEPVRPAGGADEPARVGRSGGAGLVAQVHEWALSRLAGMGRGSLADSSAAGAIPIAAPGRFRVLLAVQRGDDWFAVDEGMLDDRRSPVAPSELVIGDGDIAPLTIDVDAEALAKLVDALARPR